VRVKVGIRKVGVMWRRGGYKKENKKVKVFRRFMNINV